MCRDKKMEEIRHSLKQVHLHEMSSFLFGWIWFCFLVVFLRLSFLKDVIESTIIKAYLTVQNK